MESSSKVIRIRTHAKFAKFETIKKVLKPLSSFVNALFAEKYVTVSGVGLGHISHLLKSVVKFPPRIAYL